MQDTRCPLFGLFIQDLCNYWCLLQDEKNRQRERVVAAQQDVAKSKALLDAVDEKLRPLIDLRKSRRSEQDSIRANFSDLGVRLR